MRILIVDDKESVREALKQGLGKKDFAVEEAGNGKEALEKLLKNKPDIILLDITMPVMDGFETYKKLKENPETKNIPVIILTAKPYKEISQEMSISTNEYTEKPYNLEELYVKINNVIRSNQL